MKKTTAEDAEIVKAAEEALRSGKEIEPPESEMLY